MIYFLMMKNKTKCTVAGAGASGVGGISGGRERRAHGDAVKNITCLTNVPTPKGRIRRSLMFRHRRGS